MMHSIIIVALAMLILHIQLMDEKYLIESKKLSIWAIIMMIISCTLVHCLSLYILPQGI